MWWLYLDESGCLGFDFSKQGTSKHFTICIVATSHKETNNLFKVAVSATLKNKINRKQNPKRYENELKGSSMNLAYKKYAWGKIKDSIFLIYAITINKKNVTPDLKKNPDKLYNYISKLILNKLPFELATEVIEFIIDRSKGKKELKDFNDYLSSYISSQIKPLVKFNISHLSSESSPGLQITDLFSNGIYSLYEHNKTDWYDCFKDKCRFQELYFNKKISAPC